MKKKKSKFQLFMQDVVLFLLIFTVVTFLGVGVSYANSKKGPKVQEVNFDGSDIDGEARRPDGAYLSQRRGSDFIPLYKVREQFDQSIKDSVDHLR